MASYNPSATFRQSGNNVRNRRQTLPDDLASQTSYPYASATQPDLAYTTQARPVQQTPAPGRYASPIQAVKPRAELSSTRPLARVPQDDTDELCVNIDELTLAGIPDFSSAYVSQDAAVSHREVCSLLRRILYGLAMEVVGDKYNASRDFNSDMAAFSDIAQQYKRNETNDVVMILLEWADWFADLADAEQDAKVVLRALKRLASQSAASRHVFPQRSAVAVGASQRSEGTVASHSGRRISIAAATNAARRGRASLRPGVPTTTSMPPNNPSFIITTILMLAIMHMATQVSGSQRRTPSDADSVDEMVLIEDIIHSGDVVLDDTRQAEESLEVLCRKLKKQVLHTLDALEDLSTDFSASKTLLGRLMSGLWKRINNIYMGVLICSVAAGSYAANWSTAFTTAAGGAGAMLTLSACFSAVKEGMQRKMDDPMSTPKVMQAASTTTAKLQKTSQLLLYSYMELHQIVMDLLAARRGDAPLDGVRKQKIALFFRSFNQYINSPNGETIEMACRNARREFQSAHPDMQRRGQEPSSQALRQHHAVVQQETSCQGRRRAGPESSGGGRGRASDQSLV
ncbi:hypothetical protein BD626DRAFT_230622 [Schizophyllum amplum]|uniref:Uncharacterized protein n=1 Tax=Schizophyllum amplum TaxID=97359 RepID=A0A550BWC4_9AGAR|nr:hypothetical protein BD626DRAFT_230622 [Auriculariopsis ampla]